MRIIRPLFVNGKLRADFIGTPTDLLTQPEKIVLVADSYVFGGLIAKGGDVNLNVAYASYLSVLAEFMKTTIAKGGAFIRPMSLTQLRYHLRYVLNKKL